MSLESLGTKELGGQSWHSVIVHLLFSLFPVDTSWSQQQAALCGEVSCGLTTYHMALPNEQGT